MKATVKDIAILAKVSPATVSNALNNRKGVSEEIKQVVLEAAKELGYTKESVERNTIRFVIFKRHGHVVTDSPFFSSLVEGIEKESRTQGYNLLISHINILDDDYRAAVDSIFNDFTAGLILLATEMLPEDLQLFKNYRYPLVLIDSCFRDGIFDSVLINNEDAAFRATRLLVENGHTKIGYLSSSAYINNFCYRMQGYFEALKEFNIPYNKDYHICLEPTMEGAYRDMAYRLGVNGDIPTAFFADNDTIAFGAMRALKEKGIRIPEDVSVIGFDDMPFCEITSPRLTTVKVYKQEMGSLAVKQLMKKLDGNDNVLQKILIDTELVIRDSVKNCKGDVKNTLKI